MHFNRLAACLFLSASATLALTQESDAQMVWYVDASAPPGGDGTSWATAFNSVQPAIDAASPSHQIWVAAGTYTPTTVLQPPDPRSASFVISNRRQLFGGFNGTETSLSQRNPALYDDTILSGDLGAPGDASDNAYRVVVLPSFSLNAVAATIDGFRITGGNAVGHGNGGGVFASITTLPAFTPGVVLIDCTVNDNAADRGGAIAVEDLGFAKLLRCVVERNTAGIRGGAIYSFSGGLHAANTRFIENKSANLGGVLFSDSGASGRIQFANCVFLANKANRGGVAYIKGGNQIAGHAIFDNCTFTTNTATDTGGVIYAVTTTPTPGRAVIRNSILWSNFAPSSPSIFGTGLNVQYSDVDGGYAGSGNINVDPLFVTIDQPASGSPVNDAGNNNIVIADFMDVDGDGDKNEPLPWDILGCDRRADDPQAADTGVGTPPIVDMGAYEVNTTRCP